MPIINVYTPKEHEDKLTKKITSIIDLNNFMMPYQHKSYKDSGRKFECADSKGGSLSEYSWTA
jgi:hypothetical protein